MEFKFEQGNKAGWTPEKFSAGMYYANLIFKCGGKSFVVWRARFQRLATGFTFTFSNPAQKYCIVHIGSVVGDGSARNN